MRWDQINPVLVSLFTDIAVDQIQTIPVNPEDPPYFDPLKTPEWRAEWKEQRGDFIHPGQQQALYLKVTTCVGVGNDDTRYEMQPVNGGPDEDLVEVACGLRRFNVQVQAWVTEHEDMLWAMQTLERIRTRLDWTSSRARLLAVNVDLTDTGAATKTSATYDKRVWSIGVMDVTFTAAVNEADPIPTGWIERIRLTSHAQAGDVDLPLPLNIVDELMPE